jgi:hypothetical protein
MSRQEARAKGWNTWKENLLQYANEHPEFSLDDFILQRAETAYNSWREARMAERNRHFERVRVLYLKSSESLEQIEKLTEQPQLSTLLEKVKSEYYDFVVHRDPLYRLYLRHPLLCIKDHPGILQTELYEELHNHKRENLTYALYFAEKEGLIRREKKGRSYELFFEREKANDEPFLKLEDDEIDIQEKAAQEAAARKGCLFIFTCFFWFAALVVVGAFIGLVGAGIVVAAFIGWVIIRKILQKKKKLATTPPVISEDK